MARLLADENVPLPVVLGLRQLGHDVLTMHEAGMSNQSIDDEAVLAFANRDDRAVLTINRKHFVRLHRAEPEHPGIVVCTFDPDFERQANRIHAALESQELAGQLIRVNRPSS
jgi:predicted nuclease of predicted toxin-antitoxin system